MIPSFEEDIEALSELCRCMVGTVLPWVLIEKAQVNPL